MPTSEAVFVAGSPAGAAKLTSLLAATCTIDLADASLTRDDLRRVLEGLPDPRLVVCLPSFSFADSAPAPPALVLERNLTFPFVVVQHFAARLIAENAGGVFVNVVEQPAADVDAAAPYAAAAEALVALTRVLAVEWAPAGIRVNSVVTRPGDDPEELARLIAFVSDAGASYITGQKLMTAG